MKHQLETFKRKLLDMLEILSEEKGQWSQSMTFWDSAYHAIGNNFIK